LSPNLDWLSPFSKELARAVEAQIAEPSSGRRLACLDADGTVWSEDLGEALFRWLAAGSLLPPLGERDPFAIWEEYEARVARNRGDGFAWAVQCMSGLGEADLRRWCRQLAIAWPNYRPAMRGLITGLTDSGYDVWLVSASNIWIIEAAAPLSGIDPAHTIGIRLQVEQGRLTDRVIPPVICNAGKVEAIRQRIGRTPDIAIGDSPGDVELLESARLPLVVGRRDREDAELIRLARGRDWPVHLF
jgi:phosphoserine phosphatase